MVSEVSARERRMYKNLARWWSARSLAAAVAEAWVRRRVTSARRMFHAIESVWQVVRAVLIRTYLIRRSREKRVPLMWTFFNVITRRKAVICTGQKNVKDRQESLRLRVRIRHTWRVRARLFAVLFQSAISARDSPFIRPSVRAQIAVTCSHNRCVATRRCFLCQVLWCIPRTRVICPEDSAAEEVSTSAIVSSITLRIWRVFERDSLYRVS